MVVEYKLYLKDRYVKSSYIKLFVYAIDVDDIYETAIDLMLEYTDNDYVCNNVQLTEIISFM